VASILIILEITTIGITIQTIYATCRNPPCINDNDTTEVSTEFDKTNYIAPNDMPIITIVDTLANKLKDKNDNINIKITSGADRNGIIVTVPETGQNTARFTTSITLTLDQPSSNTDKRIRVNINDFIHAHIGTSPNSNPQFNAEANVGSRQTPPPLGNFYLKEVRPIQASSDALRLVAGKESLIMIKIDSSFNTVQSTDVSFQGPFGITFGTLNVSL